MRGDIELGNAARLASLRGLAVLDSGNEKVYDDVTQITAEICEAPICLISLVEEDRQWFKSVVGIEVSETTVEDGICRHAVVQNDDLEIEDTLADPRTAGNGCCQGENPIRFYAGALLRTLDGMPIGTLCILDFKPRHLTEFQRRALKVNAKSVSFQLELTRALVEQVGRIENNPIVPAISEEKKRLIEKTHLSFQTLTPRETEILKLIAGNSKSLSSKQIALKLGISHRTVHHHRAHIMKKMNTDSVAELIAVSLKSRIFS